MPALISKRISEQSAGGRPAVSSALQIVVGVVLALAPLVLLLGDVSADRLTANPVQEIEQQTGKAAFLLLLSSLAVTPLVRLLQVVRPTLGMRDREVFAPLRRVLGWAALLWALGHFLVFLGLDYGFEPELLWGAVADKRFALVGLGALLLLAARGVVPWIRPQPGVPLRWMLRWATPGAAALAVLHYLWAVKVITAKEAAYAAVTAAVLGAWALLQNAERRG